MRVDCEREPQELVLGLRAEWVDATCVTKRSGPLAWNRVELGVALKTAS